MSDLKHVDPLAVLDGLKQGLTQSEIARRQGLNVSSINRFLAKLGPHFKALEEFTIHQAKGLTYTLARSQRIQHEYLDEIERQIAENKNMDPSKRQSLEENLKQLGKMTWVHAVTFDKARLEGGLSTANHSIAGLVRHAHEVSPFDPATGEFKASLVGVVEKKTSTDPSALLSQDDNVENAAQVVENKGERERNVG